MKIIAKLSILTICLLTISVSYAQKMKEPVSFKLKNGISVIVAQNEGMGKVFSRLTIENQASANQSNVAKLLTNVLTAQAAEFNNTNTPNGREFENQKVSMTAVEANTATNVADFEQALTFVAETFFNTKINEQSFETLKAKLNANDELKNITLDEVKEFQKNSIKTSDTYITIAGDITPATVKTLTNKLFNTYKDIAAL